VGHNGLVMSAALNAAGNRLITTSLDQTARLWDAETEAVVTSPIVVLKENVGARMRDAEFSPDGTRVVTAGEDRTPRIWRLVPNMPTVAETYLDPAPADWFVSMAKRPYHTEQWKAWLRQKQSGLSPRLPDAGH
jgi:hypothetical protein